MRRGLIAAAVAVVAFAAMVTAAVAKTTGPDAAAQLAACTNVSLGVNAPLTGPAGFLGQEQISWARFAVSKYNREKGTRFKILGGDSQLDAARARTQTQRFISNQNVMASIGPSISQGVITSRSLLVRARMLAISPSATRIDLTLPNRKVSTFFRNVPHDGIQAPTMANFIKTNLRASEVVVVDSQDDYSVPLADGIQRLLRRQNVDVSRESVAATDTDFSSIVANVGNDVDVVVFATQTASQADTMARQLREQSKRAVVFGTDGVYSPSQYKPRTGYVSVFAADLHFLPSARSIVREYNRFSKNKTFGAFGPPTYMASWIAMNAIVRACADGTVARAELTPLVQRSNTPSILGGSIRFNRKGDIVGARFALYKVTNGVYAPVGD
jgi:branched-chain amino acid transport system substrate-binding protein